MHILAELGLCKYYNLSEQILINCRLALDASQLSKDKKLILRTKTLVAFTHLWYDKVDEAETQFEQIANELEQLELIENYMITINYLCLIYRKKDRAKSFLLLPLPILNMQIL